MRIGKSESDWAECAVCLIPASVCLWVHQRWQNCLNGTIENVPRFQTLRSNVQGHQSRPVIYWLKLWLCIHIKLLLPECSAAAGREPGGSVLVAMKRKLVLQPCRYLFCLIMFSPIQTLADWRLCTHFQIHSLTHRLAHLLLWSLKPINPHSGRHLVACSLPDLLELAMCPSRDMSMLSARFHFKWCILFSQSKNICQY